MANFSALKTAIQNAIKQNGNEEITGDVLQQILLSIVSTMGDVAINTIEQNLSNETTNRQGADTQLQNAINAIKANIDNGYVYAGIATPSTVPVSGKVFYIATAAGTYTNFGGQVLTQGINILRFNGSAWSSQQLIGIDDVPTAGSNNLVKSRGVQNELALGAVYDVSAKNPTAGPNNDGKWESLDALFSDANLNTLIPTTYRKGGMSIKFVQSSDNKYIQARCMANEFTTDTTQWAIAEDGVYVENPEFVYVKTDNEGKILWAIKADGSIYYGAGVPQQVIDYINEKIAEFSLEDIVAFLNDLEKGDETLQTLLDEKVDKVEGKSLIDAEYADGVHYIENPEFAGVWLDTDEKILFGVEQNGNFLFGCGVPRQVKEYIEQKIEELPLDSIVSFIGEYLNNTTLEELLSKKVDGEYVENPEFIEVELDKDKKVLGGRKTDGTKFENVGLDLGGAVLKGVNDPEGRLEVKTDSTEKIINYRKDDGTLVENVGIETNHLGLTEQGMSDFQQALKDAGFNPEAPTKARQYHLPKYGRVNIKSETFYLTSDSRYSDKDGIYLIQDWEDTDTNATNHVTLSNYYIKSTLKNNGDDTYSKYNDGIGGHDVKLDFYAANRVTKIGALYYATDTLVDGQVVDTSVEVTQIVDVPQYKAWPVEKASEHHCIVDIDFGYFMTKTNVPLGMKYQGQSTMNKRKRNFRITFYKKNDFKKKDKKKIGELVRLSGFNLKANWSDNSRIKEAILYRILLDVWNKRVITDRFPWDKEFGYYTGATGFINGFPMRLEFGGEFYGLDVFALKKDEKNYMLDGDDDHSGIFVCGNRRDATNWKYSHSGDWEDEMMDEMSQETALALYNFLKFISTMFEGSDGNPYIWHELTYFVGDTTYDYSKVGNKGDKIYLYPEYGGDEITGIYVTSSLVDGVPTENSISAEFVGLNKSEIEERMDVQGWIDYFICMQTFLMWDSICRNMILHTRSDKKKFYPYFYDLDLSLNWAYDADIFDIAHDMIDGHRRTNDMTLWENLKDTYWDQIVNRYCELRNTVLNTEYITALYHDFADSIPDSDYADENTKWSKSTGRNVFVSIIDKLNKRFNWLDENYFIV